MSQSTVFILSVMLLLTSEVRGVPQSWRTVDICDDGTLHEQMIVARNPAFQSHRLERYATSLSPDVT